MMVRRGGRGGRQGVVGPLDHHVFLLFLNGCRLLHVLSLIIKISSKLTLNHSQPYPFLPTISSHHSSFIQHQKSLSLHTPRHLLPARPDKADPLFHMDPLAMRVPTPIGMRYHLLQMRDGDPSTRSVVQDEQELIGPPFLLCSLLELLEQFLYGAQPLPFLPRLGEYNLSQCLIPMFLPPMQVHLVILSPEATPLDQTLELRRHYHPFLLSLPIQLGQLSQKILPLEPKGLQSAVGTPISYPPDVGETEDGLAAGAGDGGLDAFRADYAWIFGLVRPQLRVSTLHQHRACQFFCGLYGIIQKQSD